MRPPAWFAAFLLSVGLCAADDADVIYHNGKIITLWDKAPVAEAVAIRDGRFVAVGSNGEALKLAGPATRKVDLQGRAVTPGIVESHTHPIMAALSERDGPVPVMNSIPEVLEYIRGQAARLPADRLIFVPKVYSTRLKERHYPTRFDLDKAAPGRRAMTDNGYASVLNSALLKEIGVTRDSPEPADGKIIRDANGEPTGLILGAPDLLGPLRRSRPWTHDDLTWALRTMQRKYNEAGITSTVDRGQNPQGVRIYQELHAKGELTVRTTLTYLIRTQGAPQDVRAEMERTPLLTGWGDEWVRVGAIKTIVDGGILIGTAFLRAPWGMNTQVYGYVDPDYRGVLSVPKENLFEMAKAAGELGWQMTAHTAGGGAIDLLLDAYEAAHARTPIRGRRWQVTHGNFPDPRAIERAAKLGVIFDCQMAWHHFDGPALKHVFGPERMKNFLPLRSLIDGGVTVVGGSDHMIRLDPRKSLNSYHPFFGMWMAVTRKTVDGDVLNPEQRITREEALRLWTINGAFGTFEEKVKGSIEPGKFADLVVITKDYLTCPEDEIKDIDALLTVVGGKEVYGSLPR
ncbi:MAG: amidohydrolase [Bryobacteraceae bacterium]|nr:amidohydrolase [Bryobacteraceae bacterium]